MLIDNSCFSSAPACNTLYIKEDTTYSVSKTVSSSKNSLQTDFWFKDGNVILSADSVAFRVHRGVLERHSDVFRDILSIPQPVDEEMFEGCHIVEVHDEPSDLWCLLKALYDGLYFKQLSASDFDSIAAVLRLSSKYFIEHLRERCLSRLMIDWPCSLSSWDSREVEATDSFGRYAPRTRFAHPILVINFARELGFTCLLPCAFYDLCRYGPSKIVSGVLKPVPGKPAPFLSAESLSDSLGPINLSVSDLHTALQGRERAQRVVASFIEEELSNREPCADCHNRATDSGRTCREAFYYITLNMLRALGGLASGRDCDPLFSLSQASEMMSRTDYTADGATFCSLRLCSACKVDFAQAVRLGRERVWTQIPNWFGMEDFTGAPAKKVI